ncbi:MAG TPA: hypothetical protein VJ753_02695 [Rhizomicrobium sp.]|nr:hypothetical protein [Rhizomicrobium sp.]
MSSAKFASITSSLLARKGEALPWGNGGSPGRAEPEKLSLPWRQHTPDAAAPPPSPPPPAKEKSCSVRMSAHDFERLGILSIKTGTSRQQLLKDALSEFLASRADDYGCYCLGACDNDCGKAE